MGTHPDETAIRTLRRRRPLLDAWLEAMNRLEGSRSRIPISRSAGSQRRPLIQSVERHPIGRRRPLYLVWSRPAVMVASEGDG
jgi:hypothetical protein